MKASDDALYETALDDNFRARILIIYLSGAMDTGSAGHLATEEMLRCLPRERIATFDIDYFHDYRARRPVMTLDNWLMSSMETPYLALERVRDDLGNPILLLHGQEPDFHWEAFARIVADFAKKAGVEITVTFHGVPSGVPHTRPTPVHIQATDSSLMPLQPKMGNTIQFPVSAAMFTQMRLREHGINGVSLLAAVPFYVGEGAYQAGASAVLSALSAYADLTLPVGELEQGAAADNETLSLAIEANPQIQETIAELERNFDSWADVNDAQALFGAFQFEADSAQGLQASKDIGDVLEAYLANLSDATGTSDTEDEAPAPEGTEHREVDEDPLTAALRRVEARREDRPVSRAMPLHRLSESDGDDSPLRSDGVDEAALEVHVIRGVNFDAVDGDDPHTDEESSTPW